MIKKSLSLVSASGLLAGLLLVAAAPSALADTNNCPSGGIGNAATYPNASVNVTASGDNGSGQATTYSYTLDTVNMGPSAGVPGLIKLCVYPAAGTLPDATNTDAIGDNGDAWTEPPGANNFDFGRPNGNPSNIGFDGRTDYAIGDATWDAGAPNQTLLLHVNDAAWCSATYAGASQTCFAFPGNGGGCEVNCGSGQGTALAITKSAAGGYITSYGWTIGKDVDKTTVKQIGGSATFNYTVSVTHDGGTAASVTVTGTITVTNPNAVSVDIDGVTDQLSGGDTTTCTVTSGGAQTLPIGETKFAYECDLTDVPSTDTFNNATVTWSAQTLSDATSLDAGSPTFTTPTAIEFIESDSVDECALVTDTYAGTLGTACVGDANPKTFTYSRTISVPAHGCLSYDNTATYTTNDSGTTDTASRTVTVCGPATTGALTIGFWKTTNGQNLINTYCINGGNNLGTYLKGLGAGSGPFSTAPTSCASLKTYVYNILNGANAKDMNSMLKAQMLGSALDVWFSGPGWTSTTLNKVKSPSIFLSHNSLGTFKFDTTAVCPMVDNLSTGSATCKNNLPSTNAVTAGAVPASPMSMQAILDFAATSPSPYTGGVWYGGNKTLEEILKNIFDQFNNGDAFGSF